MCVSYYGNFIVTVINLSSKLDILGTFSGTPNTLDDDNNNNANGTGNGAMQTSMVLVRRIRPEIICPCTLRV